MCHSCNGFLCLPASVNPTGLCATAGVSPGAREASSRVVTSSFRDGSYNINIESNCAFGVASGWVSAADLNLPEGDPDANNAGDLKVAERAVADLGQRRGSAGL